ncbi:hypothetical protein AYJ57_21005 (plasmid) [Salipiger sp. CCB-MM3]|uniref:sensor histidine kinase n=1 Tax=Salipiger sp. CCB-MM3 TaxID=1792508 RepID=UPI00080AA4F7|nr:ATP-binding protein [Salipiger sp. CCB-MM3]ANT62958.1 hypothetical protein AYJ57_21005 [Salipiger sp. CCB-MM3]
MKSSKLTTVVLEKSEDISRLREVSRVLSGVLNFRDFERTRAVTAVVELGRNAIEHGHRGKATFSIVEFRGRPALGVTVSDQGTGIPDQYLDPEGASSSSTGMGLGLRGVQRIASRFDVKTGSEGTRIDAAFQSADCKVDCSNLVDKAALALAELKSKDPAAELAEKNRELTESLADHELLMQELHHRTGNNLALIVALVRMSKSQAEADETKQVLGELEIRVGSLAKAHELMQRAAASGEIDLNEMLSEVARNAERAFSGDSLRVDIKVNCGPLRMESKLAIDIGLIVGELVTNAYKYAFVGRDTGTITCTVSGDFETGLMMMVSDNGVGLPDGAERPERSNSLGWRMIRTLTFQHDATLTVDGSDGLSVNVKFPPKL